VRVKAWCVMLYFTFLSFLDKGDKKSLDNEALEGLIAFQGFLFGVL
jgi:hypothetical protein